MAPSSYPPSSRPGVYTTQSYTGSAGVSNGDMLNPYLPRDLALALLQRKALARQQQQHSASVGSFPNVAQAGLGSPPGTNSPVGGGHSLPPRVRSALEQAQAQQQSAAVNGQVSPSTRTPGEQEQQTATNRHAGLSHALSSTLAHSNPRTDDYAQRQQQQWGTNARGGGSPAHSQNSTSAGGVQQHGAGGRSVSYSQSPPPRSMLPSPLSQPSAAAPSPSVRARANAQQGSGSVKRRLSDDTSSPPTSPRSPHKDSSDHKRTRRGV